MKASIAAASIVFLLAVQSIKADPYEDGLAAYKRQNFSTAISIFQSLAEGGDAQGQYGLGVVHFEGKAVPQDHTAAVEWWRKAAEQGHARAQYNLGAVYARGNGVQQDYVEAQKWYRKAVEQGLEEAQINFGVLYQNGTGVRQNYILAYMWFNIAAVRGNKNAKKLRSQTRTKLSRAEIGDAQKLSRQWWGQHGK